MITNAEATQKSSSQTQVKIVFIVRATKSWILPRLLHSALFFKKEVSKSCESEISIKRPEKN